MDVPTDHIGARALRRVVTEDERTFLQGIVAYLKTGFGVAPVGEDVVIASNQVQLRRMAFCPPLEKLPAPVMAAMEKITQYEQALRCEGSDKTVQSLQGARVMAFGQRHTAFTEMRGLAQVQVRHNEPIQTIPVNGPVRVKDQSLTCND